MVTWKTTQSSLEAQFESKYHEWQVTIYNLLLQVKIQNQRQNSREKLRTKGYTPAKRRQEKRVGEMVDYEDSTVHARREWASLYQSL